MNPRNILSVLCAVAIAALTTGCADAVRLAGPGTVDVGKDYRVVAADRWSVWELHRNAPPLLHVHQLNRWPRRYWTKEIARQSQVWTKHGYVLQQLGFINGIRAGEQIIIYARRDEELRYRSGMDADSLALLIGGLLFTGTDDGIQISPVVPSTIGGRKAAYFTVQHSPKAGYQAGLEYRTAVYALAGGERLDFIYFTAPVLLYYGRYWPEAEKVIKSVRFKANP